MYITVLLAHEHAAKMMRLAFKVQVVWANILVSYHALLQPHIHVENSKQIDHPKVQPIAKFVLNLCKFKDIF